jgi:phosphate/sulfate permease
MQTDQEQELLVPPKPEEGKRRSMIDTQVENREVVASVLTPQKKANFGLNGKLFCRIITWWLITVPVAFGAAALIELVTKSV